MKIGKKFNQLTKSEYIHYISHYKKYTDFNTLGMYRSICENEKLTLNDRIEIRDYAHITFEKTFNFYQLKDPKTYFDLTILGMELTIADEQKIWSDIRTNQQKILSEKKIKHRSIGVYSKHDCGYEDCPYNGVMVKKGSRLTEDELWFHTDKNEYAVKEKALKIKKQRKDKHKIIRDELDF